MCVFFSSVFGGLLCLFFLLFSWFSPLRIIECQTSDNRWITSEVRHSNPKRCWISFDLFYAFQSLHTRGGHLQSPQDVIDIWLVAIISMFLYILFKILLITLVTFTTNNVNLTIYYFSNILELWLTMYYQYFVRLCVPEYDTQYEGDEKIRRNSATYVITMTKF